MLDARDLPDGQRLTADVCVVGAGAAGIALAQAFIGSGIDVLLLESGDREPDRVIDQLDAGRCVDERLHAAPGVYRQRRFGGSMNPVETRCTPLSGVDHEARSHVPGSGWPFGPDTLAPFHARALALCESEESQRTWERDRELSRTPLIEGFDGRNFTTDALDRYGHAVDLGRQLGAALRSAPNLCVIVNATVTRLQLNENGSHVESLIFRTLNGKAMTVVARHYVLAAGALETARLLLANRDVHAEGIGNEFDTVGRYYLCPPEGRIGRVELARAPAAAWFGHARRGPGLRSRRRIAMKAETQRRLQVGNFAARLVPLHETTRGDPGLGLLAPLLPWQRERRRYTLDFQAEQRPNPSSRVTLDDDYDALGMPRLLVDWHCNVGDFETVRIGLATLAEDLAAAAAGRLEYGVAEIAALMNCHGAHGAYQLGTARMGSDPRQSVVDANGRVHGMTNLYVTGAAVFPTSGLGDPMLTLVALSLRLAELLKLQEYQSAQPRPQNPHRRDARGQRGP